MNACVFCDLIEAGDALVANRPAAAAFFPLSPLAPGHMLVVPRRHLVDIFAADDEDLAATMQLAREIAAHYATSPAHRA